MCTLLKYVWMQITPFHLLIQQRKADWNEHVEASWKEKEIRKEQSAALPWFGSGKDWPPRVYPPCLGQRSPYQPGCSCWNTNHWDHLHAWHSTLLTELSVAGTIRTLESDVLEFRSFLCCVTWGQWLQLTVPWCQDLWKWHNCNERTGFWVERLRNSTRLRAQALKLDTCVQILAPLLNSCDWASYLTSGQIRTVITHTFWAIVKTKWNNY